MKLRNYCDMAIDEATYITHNIVNEIYSKIVEFINGDWPNIKRARKMYNLTEVMRGQGKAFIDLKFKNYDGVEARTSRYGNPVIFMKIPINYRKKIRPGEIKKILDHELVHVIDKLRSGKYELKTSKKYKSRTGEAYFKEPTEFNAIVHEIKQLATRSKKKQFSEIKNKEDFINFLKKEKLYALTRFADLIEQNPPWYKKLITRLNREDLLPPRLELEEEYYKTFKYYGQPVEVFRNSSQKEIMKVAKAGMGGIEDTSLGFRYIALPNKTLYIFSRNFLHSDVVRFLKINPEGVYLGGLAWKKKNVWKTSIIHNLEYARSPSTREKILDQDWSWLESKYNIKLPNLKQIKEEWADTVKVRVRNKYSNRYANFTTIDVFKNPTKKEIRKVSENSVVRYIAFYPTKIVYVFNPETLHLDVGNKFGIGNFFNRDDLIGGVARGMGNKWHTIEAHSIQLSGNAKKILKRDWSWVDKYINLTDFLKTKYTRRGIFKLGA